MNVQFQEIRVLWYDGVCGSAYVPAALKSWLESVAAPDTSDRPDSEPCLAAGRRDPTIGIPSVRFPQFPILPKALPNWRKGGVRGKVSLHPKMSPIVDAYLTRLVFTVTLLVPSFAATGCCGARNPISMPSSSLLGPSMTRYQKSNGKKIWQSWTS